MYDHPQAKRPTQTTRHVAVAACTFDLDGSVPTEIQLTPAGTFRARDGRPKGLSGWRIDAAIAQRVIERARQAVGDFVLDYEHQTLHTETNGQPAPAGGWWIGADMQWREGEGLFATNFQWTAAARAAIAAREYRYISPVIAYDPATGEVLGIVMAALTNFPAIDGLSDLTALAAARFNFKDDPHPHPQEKENTPVNREQLIALLGLADDATEVQINQAMTALKARADVQTAVSDALGVTGDADPVAAVAALKAKAPGKPDPAQFVPVDVVQNLQTQVAALTTQINTSQVNDLVEVAMSDGKLLPAQEKWARDLGESDIASLKSYLDNATPIAALKGGQTGGNAPEGDGDGSLSEEELAVCKATGVDPEEYKKTKSA